MSGYRVTLVGKAMRKQTSLRKREPSRLVTQTGEHGDIAKGALEVEHAKDKGDCGNSDRSQ